MKTVCFDFDGVINSYRHGWQGVTEINDPPVKGIEKEIARIRKAGYKVIIQTTRCVTTDGWHAVSKWLVEHDIPFDNVVIEKPPAIAYIDDRAICFDGNAAGLLEKVEATLGTARTGYNSRAYA